MAVVAALARDFTGGTFDERAFPEGMTLWVAGGAGCREERGISGRPFRSEPWLFLGFGLAATHSKFTRDPRGRLESGGHSLLA